MFRSNRTLGASLALALSLFAAAACERSRTITGLDESAFRSPTLSGDYQDPTREPTGQDSTSQRDSTGQSPGQGQQGGQPAPGGGRQPAAPCECVEFSVTPLEPVVSMKAVKGGKTEVTIEVPYQYTIVCSEGLRGECEASFDVTISGTLTHPAEVVDGVLVPAQTFTESGKTEIGKCKGRCNRKTTSTGKLVYKVVVDFTKPIQGDFTIAFGANAGETCPNKGGLPHTIKLKIDSNKPGGIDRDNSDYDGDGTLNKDEKGWPGRTSNNQRGPWWDPTK